MLGPTQLRRKSPHSLRGATTWEGADTYQDPRQGLIVIKHKRACSRINGSLLSQPITGMEMHVAHLGLCLVSTTMHPSQEHNQACLFKPACLRCADGARIVNNFRAKASDDAEKTHAMPLPAERFDQFSRNQNHTGVTVANDPIASSLLM